MECQGINIGLVSKAGETSVWLVVEEVSGSQDTGYVSKGTEQLSKYIEIVRNRILSEKGFTKMNREKVLYWCGVIAVNRPPQFIYRN